MRAALASASAALALLVPAASASAVEPVNIQFEAFSPTPLDVLPGETVEWTNISERAHTVTADDDTFDSGDIDAGDRYERTFDATGAYAYHCRIHPGMEGEVDVRRVILGALPIGLVEAGKHFDVDGRTADPSSPVTIERDSGDGFEPVVAVTPDTDGTWHADLVAERTAEYRARVGSDFSQTRRLLVSDKQVIVRARRGRVSVRVVPANPYRRVVLELRLRERFGWWQQRSKRLDYLSRASFRVNRRVRARVSLVDKDGWTRLAVSRVVRVRPRR
jgi:plastocyanin